MHSAVVEYGAGVNLADLHPEKPDSKEFSYKFVGWDKDTNAFYKNENVYAVYNAIPKKFTYKFIDEDGETVISQGTAIYGTPIIAPNAPKKDSSTDEVNEFSGWKNYTEGMLLTKDIVFFAEYTKKHVGGIGTSSIIKTEGENVRVVEESKLSKEEDLAQDDIKLNRLASAIKFDAGSKQETAVAEIRHSSGTGVIRKKAGMVIEQNQTAKFQAINSSERQTVSDGEVHQKIQLMTIKKTADVENTNSKIIKIKPKPEKEPEEDELLKNMMINKIKIDKKED